MPFSLLTAPAPEEPTAPDGPEAPIFTKQLAHVEVYETMAATLECEVTGRPKPEITWYQVSTCYVSVAGAVLPILTLMLVITGYGHTANRPGDSTCGVSRTMAHCDIAVLPV